MNLSSLLATQSANGKLVRCGLIGAGKFGSMFLSQVPTIKGLQVIAIADLNLDNARASCARVGWQENRIEAVRFLESGADLCALDDLDVVIEATGDPLVGVEHALEAIEHSKHIIMVNVEADALCGPALAARANQAGTVYSMAYGDQPALVSEMVDWARAAGFRVQAAGKGTKYLPSYHDMTPDGVWQHYGLSPEQAAKAGMNPQMFNSFLDGTKSAIEMSAIANACDLSVAPNSLQFPPCGVDDLAQTLCPSDQGGQVDGEGIVEVISSLERDGRPVFRDLRWGVYVVIEAPNDYSRDCFSQYGLPTDRSGRYAAMYKPFHLIGMELSISVLSAALRGEATGCSRSFHADTVAVAKKDLQPGDRLDGEGGYTVWGKCIAAKTSVAGQALPIGLVHGIKMLRSVSKGQMISKRDVEPLPQSAALRMRTDTEAMV
ncbi:MAG: flagellar biosynthesis protein FlgA [bacterium]|nr:flagellar biosynthesis protein FlgA [bacterium]